MTISNDYADGEKFDVMMNSQVPDPDSVTVPEELVYFIHHNQEKKEVQV